MENRKNLLVAMLLAAGVIFLQSYFFPVKPNPAPATPAQVSATPATVASVSGGAVAPAVAGAPAQTITVRSPLYEYRFSTRGAALAGATLLNYSSYVKRGEHVQLVPENTSDVLANRVVVNGREVLDLRDVVFTPSRTSLDVTGSGAQTLTFRYTGANGEAAQVVYTFRPDNYLIGIRGKITGTGPGTLLTEMGTGLAHHDAKEHGSAQELAVVGWDGSSIDTRLLSKVKGRDTIPDAVGWAAVKDRYFMIALLADTHPLERILIEHAPDYQTAQLSRGKMVPMTLPRARATVVSPLGADGAFAFEAYVGPQEHSRLVAAGHDLGEVNPYGYRWLRPVIRPIAAFILQVLNLGHVKLGLSYGWLLILAGIAMRVVTWPLNAKAMRAQMKNMEKQPLLQARSKEIQEKYKDDPAKQQQELFALYKELEFSPLSMVSGCVPMLIPFPVLITLFFVFRSAIEFRGTSFAWLPDLSLADPFYILPVFLVISMFALQYVSTRMSGMEQNPQTQMMMYVMPLMMGVLFFQFPSGLNLYYATTNVASLPQQLLISQERRRVAAAKKAQEAAEKAASRGGHAGARRVRRR